MAKYCLDKLHPKKVSYFDYQIEDYFCEQAAVKKIDLSCRRAAGDTAETGNIIYDITDHLPNFLIFDKFSSLHNNVKLYKRD